MQELVLIAVGTPSRADGSPNLDQIETVTQQIGLSLADKFSPYDQTTCPEMLLKSTVPVGTTRRIGHILRNMGDNRPGCGGQSGILARRIGGLGFFAS